MSGQVVHIAKIVAVVAIALLVGVAVTFIGALVGHEILVAIYGEDGIAAIDDTVPMFLAVSAAYLAGIVSGMAVIVVAVRRLRDRRA